jgi:RNA polymerase sporulation-specific sigma factor
MYEGKNYADKTDEELIELLRQGDEDIMDYIMDKYKNLVKRKVRSMYLIGGDSDDLIQEGMIGLFKAIRDYSKEKEASFYTFADLCISRQIYSAVNASNRKKHNPLNSYISLDVSDAEKTEKYLNTKGAVQRANILSPEELVIDKENVSMIQYELVSRLSKFELEVLQLYLKGENYIRISEILGKKPKAIDNALHRIRSKLSSVLY